jgi:hypothetical protein
VIFRKTLMRFARRALTAIAVGLALAVALIWLGVWHVSIDGSGDQLSAAPAGARPAAPTKAPPAAHAEGPSAAPAEAQPAAPAEAPPADPVDQPRAMVPLGTVPVPRPQNLGQFVKDESAGVALGKALFWDMQVGSDSVTACASCHFDAGADSRSKNQLNPLVGPFVVHNPNYQLTPSDFPFHRLADPADRNSEVLADSD